AMVHAGLAPQWNIEQAQRRAAEVEKALRGREYRKLFRQMYGDRPNWTPSLKGPERLRAIINVMTRLRYCAPNGRIAFAEKGAPGTQKIGLYPWFEVPGQARRDLPIVCGHWSTLGLFMGLGIY